MAKNNQIQLTFIDGSGNYIPFYFINTAADVKVGVINPGKLTLPCDTPGEILSQSLGIIKKYLSNLDLIAQVQRQVILPDSTDGAANTDLVSIGLFKDVQTAIASITTDQTAITTELAGKAPTIHLSESGKTYGAATTSLYGHVKLVDTFAKILEGDGLALSQRAGVTLKTMIDGRAPTDHSSALKGYGIGTGGLYGHLKITDTFTSKITTDPDSTALSQAGAFGLYSTLLDKINSIGGSVELSAPINHADAGTTYGGATSDLYGHVKLSDDYTNEEISSMSIAVTPFALSLAVERLTQSYQLAISEHYKLHGTAESFGHIKLTDSYDSSAGAAADGVAASSLALKNAYGKIMSTFGGFLPLVGGVLTGSVTVPRIIGTAEEGTTSTSFYIGSGAIKLSTNGKNLQLTMDGTDFGLVCSTMDNGTCTVSPINSSMNLGQQYKPWLRIYADNADINYIISSTIETGTLKGTGSKIRLFDSYAEFVSGTTTAGDYSGMAINYIGNRYLTEKINYLWVKSANGYSGSVEADGNGIFGGNVRASGYLYSTLLYATEIKANSNSQVKGSFKYLHLNDRLTLDAGQVVADTNGSTIRPTSQGYFLNFDGTQVNLTSTGDVPAELNCDGTGTFNEVNVLGTMNSGNGIVFTGRDDYAYLFGAGRGDNYYRLIAQYNNAFSLKKYVSGDTPIDTIGLNISFGEDSLGILPLGDVNTYLGDETHRFSEIYAGNGVIQTSDRRMKKDISTLNSLDAMVFISELNPVSYKFKNGTSDRTHYGLIAQDVEDALIRCNKDTKDFAGICKDYPKKEVKNEDGSVSYERDEKLDPLYSLRYDEFIAPIIAVEKLLIDKVVMLLDENKELSDRIAQLEAVVRDQ